MSACMQNINEIILYLKKDGLLMSLMTFNIISISRASMCFAGAKTPITPITLFITTVYQSILYMQHIHFYILTLFLSVFSTFSFIYDTGTN